MTLEVDIILGQTENSMWYLEIEPEGQNSKLQHELQKKKTTVLDKEIQHR